ncbi:MAG: hypothetical protein ACRERS_05415, partial [Methylococcales bacterium]
MQPPREQNPGKPDSDKGNPGKGNPGRPLSDIPGCPFENIPDPGLEAGQIDEITQLMVKLLDKRYPVTADKLKFLSQHYPDSIRFFRGVHPKSHGCVNAVFEVDPDLPKEYRVGLFNNPGKSFRAHIRFSNAAGLLGPDIDAAGRHGSRGMAIKVFNVGGNVLSDDHGAHNQDFLMINQPNFAFANSEDYLRLNRVLDTQGDNPNGFFGPHILNDPALSKTLSEAAKQSIGKYIEAEKIEADDIKRISDSFTIVGQIASTPVANPLAIQYFSAAPFLFGPDRVMKFSVRPRFPMPASALPKSPSDNYLRETLSETMQRKGTIIFDFVVQVRNEVPKDEIENASTIWDEKAFPFVRVA